MNYAMTVKANSGVWYWEDCKAKNEQGAKAEAWKRFGQGYNGDAVEVAVKHDDGQYQTIARRTIALGTRWMTIR